MYLLSMYKEMTAHEYSDARISISGSTCSRRLVRALPTFSIKMSLRRFLKSTHIKTNCLDLLRECFIYLSSYFRCRRGLLFDARSSACSFSGLIDLQ